MYFLENQQLKKSHLLKKGLDIVIGIGINVHMDESEGVDIDQSWGNLEEFPSNKLDRNKGINTNPNGIKNLNETSKVSE